jgi:hypothetical protein
MKKQNYSNHKRYYAAHHFIFLPMMIMFIAVGIIKSYNDSANAIVWRLFSLLSFAILYLAIMLRQHYALGNQNRIVRLEFRLRYYQLFGASSAKAEQQLSFAQIAALRFTDDTEFKSLLQKALDENMSGDSIKQSITNWHADEMRL